MKKSAKKLVLSRETLRALNEEAARRVVAGAMNTNECESRMVSFCDLCMPMD